MACRAFPDERLGVGPVTGSSPLDPLDGVSGRLEAASVAVTTTPFSPVLRREIEVWICFFATSENYVSQALISF